MIKWVYGVTTVSSRLGSLLPRTLESLAKAGFDRPRLFVDDCDNQSKCRKFGLEVTTHFPKVNVYANWILSLVELVMRDPNAHYYAIFQDDLVTYRNLRQYLEQCGPQEKCYWNLYTWPKNQKLTPNGETGWYLSNQRGLGALALVFARKTAIDLLKSNHLVGRLRAAHRRHYSTDGAIVQAMTDVGYQEVVHNPSLVQHTGDTQSSVGHGKQPPAVSFLGENFDALELLKQKKQTDQ